ncbi:MAG TPA: PKD domain-containing protein [Anaerolineae bacterium]|nr:PKD domain-containing protein [Anaerolineae bacterium]
MNGIRRGSRAAMLWTGILLMAVLATALVAASYHSPALAQQDGVEVSKEASAVSISPTDLPYTLYYTVTFSNSNESDVVLAVVTDTLPTGFSFITVENPVEWTWPVAASEPTLVWAGPITVPATSTLSLVYSVEVAESVPPALEAYVNNLEAETVSALYLGPASAPVYVRAPELALTKSASHTRVEPGDVVTFTVTLENSGFQTATVTAITDTLDAGLAFEQMVAGPDPVEQESTLLWTGTIEVPPLSSEVLVYRVSTGADVAWVDLCNQVEVAADGQMLGPEQTCFLVRPDKVHAYLPIVHKDFRFARIEVTRSVAPTVAATNQVVLYSAALKNVGETTGRIVKISDTLPAGFTFVAMAASSDVKTAPTVTGGTMVWTGDWAMAPNYTLDVIYEVRVAGPAGDYTSSIVVDAVQAHEPLEPATVSLRIEDVIAGLDATNDGPTFEGDPTTLSASVTGGTNVVYTWDFGDGTTGTGQQVTHIYPAVGDYTATVNANNGVSSATDTTVVTIEPAVLIDEDFEDGWEDWTEFLNYHRLAPGQWYWDADDGFNGSGGMTQNCYAVEPKEAEDALLMWLQPGAEEWTDYRMETRIILRTNNYPHGVWVRGQYEDVGDEDTAGWVTGYYIMVGGSATGTTHYVSLKQLQTVEDCWDMACNNPQNLYDFNNPHELTYTKKDGKLERYRWYKLTVEVRGHNIKAWLDDVLYIDYNDTKYPFLTGTVGVKTFKANTVSFDDIVVTPLD